ncbi:protein MEMO1 isoform X1 [Cylas formicarius]|uniref:protein MEMO1 isoform X1 n=1 Tax=Cylas formicarius TaxID=197179 RepID=UPI002958525E|nr:protein MEMO1 isoform X1 [Cylas formicarius]
MPVRRAVHAGSWYTDSGFHNFLGGELSRQLEYWLNQADLTHGPARAIIAPHAGYQYCGACGGHAYRQISPVVVRRIFVLGPSHHVRLSGCALSSAQKYKTPLYDLHIDTSVNNELEKTGQFEWMDLDIDENEHSIEMHLPYIAKVMENYKNQFTIVPILVGSLSPDREAYYGRILAPYLADPKNLFVISSDFCHWGHRFRYTYYDRSYGNIYQSIEGLDRVGMNIIENLNPTEFTNYLKKYGNTICGRHPIGILLQAIQELLRNHSSQNASLKFLKYAQSSQCRNMNDSSVSYASAALVID